MAAMVTVRPHALHLMALIVVFVLEFRSAVAETGPPGRDSSHRRWMTSSCRCRMKRFCEQRRLFSRWKRGPHLSLRRAWRQPRRCPKGNGRPAGRKLTKVNGIDSVVVDSSEVKQRLEREEQKVLETSVLSLRNMKLFDAHCHLQDPRISHRAPQLIASAIDSGVVRFAVNGVSEQDWPLVKQMSLSHHPHIVPCFGLHPWFIADRSPDWLNTLKQSFAATPSAAVGEIGLDKGKKMGDFSDQIDVFRQQLVLAKELKRPASIHCVRAFGDLHEIMKSIGSFPEGFILHSYLGSAEMVPQFADLGGYFSFSGFLMSMKTSKAKRMVKAVPLDRLLLETDAPDALPKGAESEPPLQGVEGDESLNHPVNIHNVLGYVASLLEMDKEDVAEASYNNAVRLFSY